MAVIELAALPGTGKSTVHEMVLERAAEEGLQMPSVARRDLLRATALAPVLRPAYWAGVNRLIVRSVFGGPAGVGPDGLRRRLARTGRRASTFWRGDGLVAAARDLTTPLLLHQSPLHELWRISHWLDHSCKESVLAMAHRSVVGHTIVALSVPTETALARVRLKKAKGPINTELAMADAEGPTWVRGRETYEALLGVAERRPDVQVIRLTTATREETAAAAERVWGLLRRQVVDLRPTPTPNSP